MMLYWLQQTGNRPLVLMGGGTTKIGDPTGKDESRKLLGDDEIEGEEFYITEPDDVIKVRNRLPSFCGIL